MEGRERRKVDDKLGVWRRCHRRECLRAEPPGTIVASVTRLAPLLTLPVMLTTPQGCRAVVFARAGSVRSLRVVLTRTGQSSLRSDHRRESRMREIRLPGSEGGGTGTTRSSLPLSIFRP